MQDPLRRDRHFEDTDAKRRQRIGNRVEYRRWRADRAALADTLGAGDARVCQGFQMMDFEHRNLCYRWHEIIGKRAGQYVASVVINHLFLDPLAVALLDPTISLP